MHFCGFPCTFIEVLAIHTRASEILNIVTTELAYKYKS